MKETSTNSEPVWHALYTRSRHEKKVEKALNEIGVETYCPTRKVWRQWSDRKKRVDDVLFKSYVFFLHTEANFQKVLSVPGAVRLVYYLGKPAKIRQEEIDAIRLFLEEKVNYTITFEKSDEVLITEGVLAGKWGVIEQLSKTKVRIRLQELGISLLAEVHRNKVEKKKKEV